MSYSYKDDLDKLQKASIDRHDNPKKPLLRLHEDRIDFSDLDSSGIKKSWTIPAHMYNDDFFSLEDDDTDYSKIDLSQNKSVLNFVLFADPQFGMYNDNFSWNDELKAFLHAIDVVNNSSETIDFTVLLGDNANKYINERDPSNCRRKQLHDMLIACKKLKKPLFSICGNHDIGNRPTLAYLKSYEQLFGSSTYAFVYCGCAFIMLNSSLFVTPDCLPSEYTKQFKFLETVLKRADICKARKKFLFCHHPLCADSFNENDFPDTDIMYIPRLDKMVKRKQFQMPYEEKSKLFSLLKKYEVNYTFHGHTHWEDKVTDGYLTQIVCASVGTNVIESKPGFGIVTVNANNVVKYEFKYFNPEYDSYPLDKYWKNISTSDH